MTDDPLWKRVRAAGIDDAHMQRAVFTLRELAKLIDNRPVNVLDIGGESKLGSLIEDRLPNDSTYRVTGKGVELTDKWAGKSYPDGVIHKDRYDIVVMTEVLEHLRDTKPIARDRFRGSGARRCLEQVLLVLKPSGYLFLTTPNSASKRTLHRILEGKPPWSFVGHVREYTVDEVRRNLVEVGYAIEKCKTVDLRGTVPESVENFVRVHGTQGYSQYGDTVFAVAQRADHMEIE